MGGVQPINFTMLNLVPGVNVPAVVAPGRPYEYGDPPIVPGPSGPLPIGPNQRCHYEFRSTDGHLYNHRISDLVGPIAANTSKLIVFDEAQLLISQFGTKLPYSTTAPRNNAAGVVNVASNLVACMAHNPGIINNDIFEAQVTGGIALAASSSRTIYRSLLAINHHRLPIANRARLLLLSGTPIVHRVLELAIIHSILSGEQLFCINQHVFNRDFGLVNPKNSINPNYNIDMNDRQLITLASRCKLLRGPHAFNNNGEIFINIVRCTLSNNELAIFKHQNFVSTKSPSNPCISNAKSHRHDYVFKFSNRTDAFPLVAAVNENGFLVDRPAIITAFYATYVHEFVASIRSPLAVGYADPPVHAYALPLVAVNKLNPRLVDPADPRYNIAAHAAEFDPVLPLLPRQRPPFVEDPPIFVNPLPPIVNSVYLPEVYSTKLNKLYEILYHNRTKRHVIYCDCRYACIMIGRILKVMLGMEELTTTATATDLTRKRFAYLTGNIESPTTDLYGWNPPQLVRDHNTAIRTNARNAAIEAATGVIAPPPMVVPPLISLMEGLCFEDDLVNHFSMKELLKQRFNTNTDLTIVIINNALAEGHTLKEVDFIHMYSLPGDNMAKLQQITARAIRNCVRENVEDTVTPLLYLSENPAIMDHAAIRLAATALFPNIPNMAPAVGMENQDWIDYNNAATSDVRNIDQVTKFTEIINDNCLLMPYLYLLSVNTIDTNAANLARINAEIARGPNAGPSPTIPVEPRAFGPLLPGGGTRSSKSHSQKYSRKNRS